jgi:hypothetical protein
MNPFSNLVIACVSVLLFAVGGRVGQIGLMVLFLIAIGSAFIPLPRISQHLANMWVFNSNPFKPMICILEPSDPDMFSDEELSALMAHEHWHCTPDDKVVRFWASGIGGVLPAASGVELLRWYGQASLRTLAFLIGLGLISPLIQYILVSRSEARADNYAVQILGVGSREHLARAREKMRGVKRVKTTELLDLKIEIGGKVIPVNELPNPLGPLMLLMHLQQKIGNLRCVVHHQPVSITAVGEPGTAIKNFKLRFGGCCDGFVSEAERIYSQGSVGGDSNASPERPEQKPT